MRAISARAGCPVSKKQQRLDARLSVAALKRLVARPDVVEAHDVTAADPRLLVFLKSCRNTVPVPRHWCRKRKYLQGKRGIEKPAFALPDFIVDTGRGLEAARARVREIVGTVLAPTWTSPRRGVSPGGEPIQ